MPMVFRLLAAFLSVVACLSLLPQAATAQGALRGEYGDWQIRCDMPPGARDEVCVLIQQVTAEDRENVGLRVIILKTTDQQSYILRVQAPLGVLLPAGLGLRVDEEDIGRTGFIRCRPDGCFADVAMDEQLIAVMSSGVEATFIIFQTPEAGIGIPISLNGFDAGFAALQ